MAELADALDSGSNVRKDVQVQVLLPAPKTEAQSLCGCVSVFLVSVTDFNRLTLVPFRASWYPLFNQTLFIESYRYLNHFVVASRFFGKS